METSAKTKRRIMIVLWKWEWLKGNKVNDGYLENGCGPTYLTDVKLGKEKFYREVKVEESEMSKDALLVAASIFRDGEKAQQVLDQLLRLYEDPRHKVMLFLHRGNHYDQEDVQRILTHHPLIDKCFLFAHGRDFIYYNKKQDCGLLAQNGRLYIGRNDKDELVETYDKKSDIIKQPYFDRVWRYYEHEFQRKIFGLKQDIFNELFEPFLLPALPDTFSKDQMAERIRKGDNFLFIRIKSFLGMYDRIKELRPLEDFDELVPLQQDLKRLERFEKEKGQSYIFDDCRAFLEQQESAIEQKVNQQYDQLEARMKYLFIDNGKEPVRKKDLLELEELFTRLINIVIEEEQS